MAIRQSGVTGPHLPAEAQTNMRWFAVNTLPHAEPRAIANLERQGWRCFCPQVLRTTRSGRRMMTRLRPLFPGYAFLQMDPLRSAWRSVDGTSGVRHIVKAGDRPVPLPEGIVETLMAMTDSGGKLSFASSLSAGDNVRFLAGPFSGLVGKLAHLDAAGRITVLLDLLGRETPTKGFVAEVSPAPES